MIRSRWLGGTRHDVQCCASTNDEADALARDGAPHGTIVIAREQTGGRGRGGHDWFSPDADNLYLSCVLRPELSPVHVPPITLTAGVAVYDAVNSYGPRPSLKWPNDVLVHGRKLAGVLAEMSTRGQQVEHLILGIGVNINGSGFPPELAGIAISLRQALGGRAVDREAFTQTLLWHLEKWLDRFFVRGIEAVSAPWTERAEFAGRRIHTDVGVGVARGLDADGALLLESEGGAVVRVVAGDVTVLR